MPKVKKYAVGFLEGDTVINYITVKARNPQEAYYKAETLYIENKWKFAYTDMFCEEG